MTRDAVTAQIQTSLNTAVAAGTVTAALKAYGFPTAVASTAPVVVTPSGEGSSSKDKLAQDSLIAIIVCSVVGGCCFCGGGYFWYKNRTATPSYGGQGGQGGHGGGGFSNVALGETQATGQAAGGYDKRRQNEPDYNLEVTSI